MCHPGMEDESVTETRVGIYEQLKTKTSQSIPSDENSILQATNEFTTNHITGCDQILL